ncbi:protein Frey isoform X1 [Panthera pardus]|uniref:Protein Frey isoform X1 n=1 Tax=Panthera pardus TaxID=9691 RepID=A0A9V1DUP6_PANPR|nr:protein Frey isoform X1 [Panthera pardus]
MVLAMLGALYPRAGLSLFLLDLVLAAALLGPQPPRYLPGSKGQGSTGPGGLEGGWLCHAASLSPPLRTGWCHYAGRRGSPCPLPWALTGEVVVAFGARAEHPNISHRPQRSVPEELSGPLEISQPFSGLVDDYGIRPKHPWPRGPRPLLSQAQQRKRDGPDMAEYYYDAHL